MAKRYGITGSRTYYGTLDKARSSAYAKMSKVKDKPHSKKKIAIHDADNENKIVGYVCFNWYGKICWSDPKEDRTGWTTHYVNKDGSIRKM